MKFTLKVLILIIIPISLLAQSSTSYTRLGIGDIYYSFAARTGALGSLNTAYTGGSYLTALNPASWSSINRTRIEFASEYNGVFLSNNSGSNYFGNVEFTGFSFGFPVSQLHGIGAVMGLVPYSNVSYKTKETSTSPSNETYTTTYEGKGGLSKVFIGSSYLTPMGFNIGATLDYYFGNIEYFSNIAFDNSDLISTEYIKKYSPKGLGSTVGIISPDFSKYLNNENISELRFGVSANIISSLATDTSLIKLSSAANDTIGSAVVDMKIPLRVNAGVSLIFKKLYAINLDYSFQPWSNFSLNGIKENNLRDAHKISAGFEYRPQRELGATFWEQIVWRAGLSFEQTQYEINGTGINQYSVGGGFALPMGTENSLDLSIQYSMRGTEEANLFKENRIILNLGFSLGEVWFLRQDK